MESRLPAARLTFTTLSNISGIRSSRPKANAAAWQCVGAVSTISHVMLLNLAAGSGTFASLSAVRTGTSRRSSSTKASIAVLSAPAWVMPFR